MPKGNKSIVATNRSPSKDVTIIPVLYESFDKGTMIDVIIKEKDSDWMDEVLNLLLRLALKEWGLIGDYVHV